MLMKKIFFFCMCTIAILLVGCGKDPIAKRVTDDINSIGEVTLEDEELINKTYELYNTLSDSQKDNVDNYLTLIDAMDELEKLKAEYALEKGVREAELNIQREYYDEINRLLGNLPDNVGPINEIICIYPNKYDSYSDIYVSVGAAKQWYAITLTSAEEKNLKGVTEFINAVNGENATYRYKLGEHFYCTKESVEEDGFKIAFLVDLDDLENYDKQ